MRSSISLTSSPLFHAGCWFIMHKAGEIYQPGFGFCCLLITKRSLWILYTSQQQINWGYFSLNGILTTFWVLLCLLLLFHFQCRFHPPKRQLSIGHLLTQIQSMEKYSKSKMFVWLFLAAIPVDRQLDRILSQSWKNDGLMIYCSKALILYLKKLFLSSHWTIFNACSKNWTIWQTPAAAT